MSIRQREALMMALVVTFFINCFILPVGASVAPGASVQINSTPSGAIAYVDGHPIGSTPVHLKYLSYGKYIISLTKEGYQKYERSIYVPVYGQLVTVDANLVPDTIPEGSIRVNTTLMHYSEASVDGGVYKQVPAKFDNLSGNNYHVLTINQSDKLLWHDNVLVLPGATTEVHENIQPYEPVSTRIKFNATPAGGFFCIDAYHCWFGQGVWGNPDFYVQANQYHTITIEYEGYRPFSTEFNVTPLPLDQFKEVKVDLLPDTIPVGTIQVNTAPAGGTVCLDGIRCDANVATIDGMGRALFADVSANTLHSISVNLTGYQPYTSQVSVDENKMLVMTVPLRPVEPESTRAMLTQLVNICRNWDLLCSHMQEKTKDTNLTRKTGQLSATIPQAIQVTNPYPQTTAVPAESPDLHPDIVKQGDIVSLDLVMGDNENNISIDSEITLFAGQTSDRYYVINGTSNQSTGSKTFTLFSNEYNAISSGIIGMKPGEQKNISVHFKDKIETQTMSSESLKRFKIDASNLSVGKLIVGTYNAPNSSSAPSTRLGKVVSGTHDYAIIDYSYPDIQVKISQIWNGSINTTPVP